MTLEHRCARRYALALPVRLYSAAFGELRGIARDVSSGGMFVALGGVKFAPWSVVEIELPPSATKQAGRRVRRPAIVVHRQPDGVGLMFDEVLAPDTVARLVRPSAPAHRVAEAAAPPVAQLRA